MRRPNSRTITYFFRTLQCSNNLLLQQKSQLFTLSVPLVVWDKKPKTQLCGFLIIFSSGTWPIDLFRGVNCYRGRDSGQYKHSQLPFITPIRWWQSQVNAGQKYFLKKFKNFFFSKFPFFFMFSYQRRLMSTQSIKYKKYKYKSIKYRTKISPPPTHTHTQTLNALQAPPECLRGESMILIFTLVLKIKLLTPRPNLYLNFILKNNSINPHPHPNPLPTQFSPF